MHQVPRAHSGRCEAFGGRVLDGVPAAHRDEALPPAAGHLQPLAVLVQVVGPVPDDLLSVIHGQPQAPRGHQQVLAGDPHRGGLRGQEQVNALRVEGGDGIIGRRQGGAGPLEANRPHGRRRLWRFRRGRPTLGSRQVQEVSAEADQGAPPHLLHPLQPALGPHGVGGPEAAVIQGQQFALPAPAHGQQVALIVEGHAAHRANVLPPGRRVGHHLSLVILIDAPAPGAHPHVALCRSGQQVADPGAGEKLRPLAVVHLEAGEAPGAPHPHRISHGQQGSDGQDLPLGKGVWGPLVLPQAPQSPIGGGPDIAVGVRGHAVDVVPGQAVRPGEQGGEPGGVVEPPQALGRGGEELPWNRGHRGEGLALHQRSCAGQRGQGGSLAHRCTAAAGQEHEEDQWGQVIRAEGHAVLICDQWPPFFLAPGKAFQILRVK